MKPASHTPSWLIERLVRDACSVHAHPAPRAGGLRRLHRTRASGSSSGWSATSAVYARSWLFERLVCDACIALEQIAHRVAGVRSLQRTRVADSRNAVLMEYRLRGAAGSRSNWRVQQTAHGALEQFSCRTTCSRTYMLTRQLARAAAYSHSSADGGMRSIVRLDHILSLQGYRHCEASPPRSFATASPTTSPTASPTASPTISPTVWATASPTV